MYPNSEIKQSIRGNWQVEKILNQILTKLDNLESDVKELKPLVNEDHKIIKEIASSVKEHDNIIKEIASSVREDHKAIKELKLKVDESHQWIRTLVENKDIQKAETDKLQHKVAAVEGVLQGFANCLEAVKKAQ